MGNDQTKGSVQTPVPPKDEGFITVTQQYDAEVDPILVQLENCPQFARPILETNARRFVIDSGSIESIMERIQEVLALSSKAAANEQKLLNGKLAHIEQLCQRLLHNLANQLGAMRSLEVRLNDVQQLTAATAQLEKSAAHVKDRLDQLDEYLQQLQR
eukprot:TRINITY_DN13749_c0_g1_i1.p1 TRINITY_DN13749_c0_g1~~TRINITY_DN13749_c0_g1_i1.p1  ORF type:complete len:158 (+),score=15.96 TRINITY_DN13749_c0_g1_i1:38-511(+)